MSAQQGGYNLTQARDNHPPGVERHFWHVARNRVVERSLRRAGCTNARILDVGCGPGVAVRYLLSRGFDAWGVDPTIVTVVPGAQERLRKAFAESLPNEFRESIECLMLLDVIEHIDDAPRFMCTLVDAFPNARNLIVAVPARPEAWSAYDDHYDHKRRYTPQSLQAALSDAGLRPLDHHYFFHSLYLAALAINICGIQRQVVVSAPTNQTAHRLLGNAFDIEARLLGRFTRGLSLLAVAART